MPVSSTLMPFETLDSLNQHILKKINVTIKLNKCKLWLRNEIELIYFQKNSYLHGNYGI